MNITIYHNPRCSKSRATLALLEEHGHQPKIITYLQDSPSPTALKIILSALGLAPRGLLRKGEQAYKDLALADPGLSDDKIIKAMAENPILIERPIVVNNDTPNNLKAAIGRPPEAVLDIL